METEKVRKTAELEITAMLSGETVATREICDKWILLTYDMPHTVAGDKARRNFLIQARKLGACQHTESVYLMPYSAAAGEVCLELAKAGKLFVWTSESTNPDQAREITTKYDKDLRVMLTGLSERIDRMIELRREQKFGRLDKMRKKTEALLSSLGDAVRRRESADLSIIFQAIVLRYNLT